MENVKLRFLVEVQVGEDEDIGEVEQRVMDAIAMCKDVVDVDLV